MMTFDVYWQDSKQEILILHFEGHFELQELRDARELEARLTAGIEHPFYMLYDFGDVTKLTNMPNGLTAYFKQRLPVCPTVEDIVVVVPKWARSLARAILQIGNVLNPQNAKKVKIMSHRQDALDFLEAIKKTKA